MKKLKILRNKLDKIDKKIINLLSDRMKISKNIGIVKKENNICITQNDRWDNIIDNIKKMCVDKDINPNFVLEIYDLIHKESINNQK